MDRLFAQAFPELGNTLASWPAPAQIAPRIDVSETPADYRIEVELPGVPQDAVDVHVVEGTLTVRAEVNSNRNSESSEPPTRQAQDQQEQQPQRQYHYRERRWGQFERVFHLPSNADEDNIQAGFQDGILTLTVPKKEPMTEERRGRRIAIASTESQEEMQSIESNTAVAAADGVK